jgi:hypothetical protein
VTVTLIARHYHAECEALFGPLPDRSDPARFPAGAGPVDDPAARARDHATLHLPVLLLMADAKNGQMCYYYAPRVSYWRAKVTED